jgi:cephalosporin hydroxylase
MSDPVTVFEQEREANIRALGTDAELRDLSLRWIMRSARHRYSYNFSWLGRPVIQYPQDLFAVQEIIWRTRPDLVIETGVAHGGSLIFWASILELLGGAGRVVGVDIEIRSHNRSAIEAHPLARRITLVEGSSIDGRTVERVRSLVQPGDRVMVVLDSHHAHDHVLRELEIYSTLVTKECYLVVFDTVIEDLPAGFIADRRWDRGNNPATAVRAFLLDCDRFVRDEEIVGKVAISAAPGGFLRCVKDLGE